MEALGIIYNYMPMASKGLLGKTFSEAVSQSTVLYMLMLNEEGPRRTVYVIYTKYTQL